MNRFLAADLPIITQRNNLPSWIKEYTYTDLCKERTISLLNILKDPDFIDTDRRLSIYISDPAYIGILNVADMNYNEVNNQLLNILIDEKIDLSEGRYYGNVPYNVFIYYDLDNDYYELKISESLKFHITVDAIYGILFQVQYHNINMAIDIPSDDINDGELKTYGLIGRIKQNDDNSSTMTLP